MKSYRLLTRLLALLLVTVTVMGMLVACKKPEDPNNEDPNAFKPVVRFAVASDLHLRDDGKNGATYDFNTRNQLKALYETAYGYSATQSYNKLDGVFLVGDFTQNGYDDEEMKDYFAIVNKYTQDGTVSKAILGNHEFYETASDKNSQEYKDKYPNGYYDHRYTPESIAGTYANFLKYSGNKTVDEHMVINGYHFIFLALDLYKKSEGEFYSEKQLDWLADQLQAASSDDPTGKKPIFVFQHVGPAGTALGTSDKNIGKILKAYPQVVDFCGHSHTPLTDPRSIWQGDYTVLNTGSMAYLGISVTRTATESSFSVKAIDKLGGWATGDVENALRTGGMYYIIEIDAKNVMRVVIYDVFENAVYGEPFIIDSIGQPDKFTFTDARKRTAEKPAFADGTKLEIMNTTQTAATIKIPQATAGAIPQSYRCEVYVGNSLQSTTYRLSCSFLGAGMPEFVTFPISGLRRGTSYTVKIYPHTEWGKVGNPLTISFTTKNASDRPEPDYLSVQFQEGGVAVNANTTLPLATTGSAAPKTEWDDTLQRWVGVFNGKGAFTYPMYNNYDLIKDGYSVEILVQPEYKSTTQSLISNQHSAGFGLDYISGSVYYYQHNGSEWKKPKTDIMGGEWVHIVGVYDGTYIRLYVNGVKKTDAYCTAFTIPSAVGQYLVIGGDADNGNGQNFLNGKIAFANVYTDPLSATDVLELYNNAMN